ncbi:MAG: peptidylprolyl isomerase [Planctomycetes bacterium]|nr:peptidylprolyl isomerase [Planctomycetota bacterium]
MMIATLALAAALFGEPQVSWSASQKAYVKGMPFPVKVELAASTSEEVPVWMAEASGFTVNGKPIGKRSTGKLMLAAGAKFSIEFDLGPQLADAAAAGEFKLGFADGKGGADIGVTCWEPAPAGLDFMKMEPADLAKYQVLMNTNRGAMRFEMWPDVAPGHVRNFLDLCYTKFYDSTQFHRVKNDFMIQGGDPNTKSDNQAGWGMGNGPRMLKAEFSKKHHERGVLSMARGGDPDSASCQFFVMTGAAPFLDGKYSTFGKLLDGDETLEAIGNAKGLVGGDGTIRPRDPQKILSAIVIRAPAK